MEPQANIASPPVTPGQPAASPVPTVVPAAAAPVSTKEAPKAEAPATKEPAKVEAPKEERVSPKLQALVRREKEALAREQAAKAEKAQALELLKQIEAREARVKEFETLKQTNPRKALELLGLSYNELTQAELNDGMVTPDVQVKRLEAKLDSFQKKQEEDAQAAAEAAKQTALQEEKKELERFQGQINSFCEQNSKKYELIQFEKQHNLVLRVIDEHYTRTIDPATGLGKIMSIQEAADKVEAFLEKKYEQLTSLEKIKSRFQPQPEAKPAAKPQQVPGQKPTTMTNQMSATPTRPRAGMISDEERIAKAIAYARGLRP